MNPPKAPRGCSFLLQPIGTEQIFAPDNLTDDQRMFAKSVEDFMNKEILPDIERLEHQEEGLMVQKLRLAGEMGLLMLDVPERWGGLALDKTTSMLCSEKLAVYPGFSVSHGAHTGIGMLPLTFFGNDEQRDRYLRRLASGELLAAYALTEPGSGSDALGARTTAVREVDADGSAWYRLNGTKMWITNAGFADLFTVFAKVDGDKFTAFLVERAFTGVSTGAEERKMGIKGSSTRMLILEDVRVPAQNVLGQIGRGHKIAFNILNFGRFKLGVGVLGGGKRLLEVTLGYARDRRQFNTAILEFGAIRQKVADMAIRLYALESMCYRVAGYMDTSIDRLDENGGEYAQQVMDAIEEFAVEDSILKVFGSETIDFVVDECVQIHGGYGFSQEYEVERAYRDSRINRIFEGTNEINRMLIPGLILKRAMKGELNLFGLVAQVQEAAAAEQEVPPAWDANGLSYEMFLVEQTKALTVYTANLAIQKHMADLKDQQELLLALADLFIAAYGVDSTVARVRQLHAESRALPVHLAIAQSFTAQTYRRALQIAEEMLPSVASGDALVQARAGLGAFTFPTVVNCIARKRVIADFMAENPRYAL